MKPGIAIPVVWFALLLTIPCSLLAQIKGNTTIFSFRESKRVLSEIYQQDQLTFYCGCSFKKKAVDHSSCRYQPRKLFYKSGRKNERAYRIEWEHVVPAHAFGQSFREWREGNPKCVSKNGKPYKSRRCARTNETFRRMEADLYNLVTAIREVNANRSNYSIAMIPDELRKYGQCDVEI